VAPPENRKMSAEFKISDGYDKDNQPSIVTAPVGVV
jgi:hypothetical protein